MLYVYAIVDSHRFEAIPGEGHEGGDVVPVRSGALAAAVSQLSGCAIEATPQRVWRHERVVQRLMRDHAVLPLRFGTICRDADALRECLLCSAGGFVDDFARVRGKVELALRIAEDGRDGELPGGCTPVPGILERPGDGEPAGRGWAHLRARRQALHGEMAREDRASRMRELLRRDFDALLSGVVCAAPADSSASLLVSCLVERVRVAAFADALDRFRRDHPRFEIGCTGPWAPYSFVAAPPVSMGAP
jgi:hypothetical protein